MSQSGVSVLWFDRRVVEVRSLAVHVNTTLQAQAMLLCIACNMSITLKWYDTALLDLSVVLRRNHIAPSLHVSTFYTEGEVE